MSINFHIDRIVVDGLDVDPTQAGLLQRSVTTQLTKLLTDQGIGFPPDGSTNRGQLRSNSLRLGFGAEATSFGPQLANAIYASIPQSGFDALVMRNGL
jgi:hypothetical protein